MSEAPESAKHWTGRDPADAGHCPECGTEIDVTPCRCFEEEEENGS